MLNSIMNNNEFTCRCGRVGLHCPRCGYKTVYGLAKNTRELEGVLVYSYRCRKCGKVFDDTHLSLCSATSLAASYTNKVVEQVKAVLPENATRAERLAWVHEQLSKHNGGKKQPVNDLEKDLIEHQNEV